MNSTVMKMFLSLTIIFHCLGMISCGTGTDSNGNTFYVHDPNSSVEYVSCGIVGYFEQRCENKCETQCTHYRYAVGGDNLFCFTHEGIGEADISQGFCRCIIHNSDKAYVPGPDAAVHNCETACSNKYGYVCGEKNLAVSVQLRTISSKPYCDPQNHCHCDPTE